MFELKLFRYQCAFASNTEKINIGHKHLIQNWSLKSRIMFISSLITVIYSYKKHLIKKTYWILDPWNANTSSLFSEYLCAANFGTPAHSAHNSFSLLWYHNEVLDDLDVYTCLDSTKMFTFVPYLTILVQSHKKLFFSKIKTFLLE